MEQGLRKREARPTGTVSISPKDVLDIIFPLYKQKEYRIVESDQDQLYQSEDDQSHTEALPPKEPEVPAVTEVVPGAPVTRGNTPRPLPFEELLAASGQPLQHTAMAAPHSTFPSQAPSAPPLPEEIESDETLYTANSSDIPELPENSNMPLEFIWLFEYGLEMESTVLNSPDRLDGAAFVYGPAVLRGYTLMFATMPQSGQYAATIVPCAETGAEVWGLLYRVPRRVTVRGDKQRSLLDSVHEAGTSTDLFSSVAVVVREIFREREISCGTYILTAAARQQLQLLTPEQADHVTPLVRRIAALAKEQKLPTPYLTTLVRPSTPSSHSPSVSSIPGTKNSKSTVATLVSQEQNTDPLPILKETDTLPAQANLVQKAITPILSRWLIILAVYQIFVIVCVLTFAVLQSIGFARHFLTADMQLLGVPWLVLVYGVLGGCVSGIVALGRSRRINTPLFVLILWFVRPLLGGVLALFSYLFFNSGLFTTVELTAQHTTLFPLLGACAGFCEGWLFAQKKS